MKLSECGSWTLEKLESELAKLRARPSPTGSGTGRLAEDAKAPPAPEERAGVDYFTSEMIYWTLDLAARLKWTNRSTDELRKIMNEEAGLDDKAKTRFYVGGVEWKP